MAVNGSIGRGAATAALACMLGVSMAPAAALANSGNAASGKQAAAIATQDDGSKTGSGTVGGSGKLGSGSDAKSAESSGSGTTSDGSGEGGTDNQGGSNGETGSGQEGSGGGSQQAGGNGEGSGTGEGSGSGSGAGEGAGTGEGSGSGSGAGEGSGGSSGEGSGSGAGQGGQGGQEGSGSSEGSGGSAEHGSSTDKPQTVLDLGASSTKVTVADVTVGEEPIVKVAFAGGSARTVSSGSAFTVTFFGPDGNKVQSFDEPGRYSVRVQAASSSATTSAGEAVKGKSALVFFQVKEKQADPPQGSGTGASKDGSSASGQAGGSGAEASGAIAQANSAAAAETAVSNSGASSAAAAKDAAPKSSKEKTTKAKSTRTYRYVASGGGGGVTYLAPVNLTRSGSGAGRAAGSTVASATGAAAASGAQVAVGSYSLDAASTDVSSIVTQASGAEVLFWGGGTEVAPGYIWSVNTQALTRDDAFGLDLKVSPSDAAARVAKGADATSLRVEQSGAMPAGLRLFWRTSSVFFDGQTVDVYRIDPQTGECTVVAEGIQTADGYVGFDVAEGGEYVVAEAGADLDKGAKVPSITEIVMPAEAYADSPSTEPAVQVADEGGVAGDLWAIPAGIAAACASAAGVWFAMRRKLKAAAGGVDAGASDE